MPGSGEMAHHRRSHDAKPDEADLHVQTPWETPLVKPALQQNQAI
jgi:hypothetical protein